MKKKIICVFIALLMALGLAAGCTEDKPVRDLPPIDPIEQETGDFTVTLVLNGKLFMPPKDVTVTWDDGYSRPHTAEFGNDGVAYADGLDGDYTIRINGLPDKYAYDPNNTHATNYNRKIRLDVYVVKELGEYTAPTDYDAIYGAKTLPAEGVYRLTLKSAIDIFYCIYKPVKAGMYAVTSLADITENAINPKYRICYGSFAFMKDSGTVLDGGGASSTYTVNFKYETGFNQDEMGGVLIFGVMAETRTLSFPLQVDILVKRTGNYVRQDAVAQIALPTEFDGVTESTAAEFRAQKDAFMRNGKSNFNLFYKSRLLDGDSVAFNEDTGYYHLYDKATGEYGAVVCAKISQACGILELPFTAIEYQGNKALTVDDNYDKFYKKTPPKYGSDKDPHYINYKVFIEGYAGIAKNEGAFPGISAQYAEYKGVYGYADFCNGDGVYPVNKELMRFLQGYATNQRLFMDGNGWAEAGLKLMSAEEDQWMFACGYYY